MPDHSDGKIRSGGFKLEEWVDKPASEFNYGVSGVVKRPPKVGSGTVLTPPNIVVQKVEEPILSGGPNKRNEFVRYRVRASDKTDLMSGVVILKPTKLPRRPKAGTYITRAK